MSFPSPSLAAPALTVGQLSYGGLVFGGVQSGATYQIVGIEGLDPPDVLAGDQQRAEDQGEFAGLDVLPGRDITIIQNITAGALAGQKPTAAQLAVLANARMTLGGVLGVKGTEEEPLWVQTEAGIFACMARPRKHHFPWNSTVFITGSVTATTLFHATDPRWYAAPSKTATVGLPPPSSSGLVFPVTFPVTFPGSSVGGILTVHNTGRFEMRPVLVIVGPCTTPEITNLSLPGNPSLTINTTLNTGDTLTIDTDFQTIQFVAAGTTIGSSRRFALAAGSTWWNLPAESTCLLEFNTSDTVAVAGTLTVESADAWIGL
jgi:hypothetical protein